MEQTVYVCTGGCGGEVTEAEYRAGKTTCGAPDCPRHGQPFEPRTVCAQCGARFASGTAHACAP